MLGNLLALHPAILWPLATTAYLLAGIVLFPVTKWLARPFFGDGPGPDDDFGRGAFVVNWPGVCAVGLVICGFTLIGKAAGFVLQIRDDRPRAGEP